ncbi:hypothetical protein AHF37_06904 [Paragonimus kellicotti]|nr:hypothetical protein AHF37_06904 [Paragonimus kellicotti]
MNNFGLERIPLPRFSTYVIYTVVSILGSFLRVCYQVWFDETTANHQNTVSLSLSFFVEVFVGDTWFLWSLVNLTLCLLMCIGRRLQKIFFGELRESENTHIRENFLNFIFYKVVFVYGILNVEALLELLLWASWFSVLGFLHLLTGLIKDRSEYLMQSLDEPLIQTRMLYLLCFLLVLCNLLMAVSVAVGAQYSWHLMFFMLTEVFQLGLETVHVIVWYAIHIYSEVVTHAIKRDGLYHKYISVYYTEMLFSSIADFGDVLHNIHLFLWNRFRINMSGIIVGMHLQHLYYKLSRRYHQHKKYQNVLWILRSKCQRVTKPNEDCAVCWQKLIDSRQLPCGHIFHAMCLHRWIERNATCPTCRIPLDLISQDNPCFLPSQTSLVLEQQHVDTHGRISNFTDGELHGYYATVSAAEKLRSEEMHITLRKRCLDDYIARHTCASASEHSFLPLNDYTSNPSTVSAMVSINHLLDVPNDSVVNTTTTGYKKTRETTTPARFFDALEAELFTYFQPREDNSCTPEAIPTIPDSFDGDDMTATVSTSGEAGLNDSGQHERVSAMSALQRSGGSTREDESDSEFPPKRVLRFAIRHLLHRVASAVQNARVMDSESDGQFVESDYCPNSDFSSILSDRNRGASFAERSQPSSWSTAEWRSLGRTDSFCTKPIDPRPATTFQFANPSCTSNIAPQPNVFYSTRDMRECVLRRRKTELLERARCNFIR